MATTTPGAVERKDARLAVRLTPNQRALIDEAATASGQSLTEFVTTAALVRAEEALADRRLFHIDDAAWKDFNAILDRPAMHRRELANLLKEAAPWD